jgi:hypothetical protein
MATYSIKAPNGKTYRIDGPAGADDAAVRAQVLKQYPDAAGPAPSAAPKTALPTRTAAPQPAGVPASWSRVPKAKAAAILTQAQNSITRKLPPEQHAAALERFNADPRMAALRKIAGLAPVTSRKSEIRRVAREAVEQERSGLAPDWAIALKGGITRGLFGIPERLAAAGLKYSGNAGDLSYDETLEAVRAKTDAELALSTPGNIGGQIVGGVVGGGVAGKALKAGAGRLIEAGTPALARAGNVLQSLMTVKKGQGAANTGRVALAGATGGGAQALGEGSDVTRGALYGAGGATALRGGGKAIAFIGRPVGDFLGMTSAKSILRRFTSTTAEEIERKAAEYRTRTGAEPTVYELLPLEDRDAMKKAISLMPAKAREKLTGLVQERGQNIGPEMAAQTGRIIAPAQGRRVQGIANDLARARNPAATPTPEEAALAARASRSPVDLEQVRADEARAIMAPHDDTVVAADFADLIPQAPVAGGRAGSVAFQPTDPEVAAVLRSVAGTRRLGSDITVRDITDMVSDLRDDVTRGGAEGRIAQRAIDHLQDQLPAEARAAADQMTEAFAGRSRMMEGMAEGGRTRLRQDVPVGDRTAARKVRQAYDTPEGASGRAMGQASRLERDVLQTPQTTLRAVDEIASNPSKQAAISANLGTDEGARIADAARAQGESARNLAGLTKDVPVNAEAELGLSDIARSLISMTPGALPATRLWSLSRISRLMTHLPAKKSEEIVNGLFSQNPAEIAKGMKFLNNEGDAGRQVLRELGVALVAGARAGQVGQTAGDPDNSAAPLSPDQMPDGVTIPEGGDMGDPMSDDQGPIAEGDSPYAENLQHIYDNEDPDLLDLVERVQGQESGGDQSAVSSAGAVGVMQVMPDTAPEAAQMAGLPWDPEAYHNDAAYNKLLGIAYLSSLLEKYDGDVEKALAAYNAGQGRVDDALSQGGDWIGALPAETQNYVAKLG